MSDERNIVEHRLIECRCGKVMQETVREATPHLVELTFNMKACSICRACSTDIHQRLDMCPEWLPIPGGVSACSLGWAHTGRCHPEWPIRRDGTGSFRLSECSCGRPDEPDPSEHDPSCDAYMERLAKVLHVRDPTP